jgi:hypothetical protein
MFVKVYNSGKCIAQYKVPSGAYVDVTGAGQSVRMRVMSSINGQLLFPIYGSEAVVLVDSYEDQDIHAPTVFDYSQ